MKLDWHPKWHVDTAIQKTVEWHNNFNEQKDMYKCSTNQILSYQEEII